MGRIFIEGNEAIARGAYEYGVHIAAAYPGTPSTEILENVGRYEEIYAQWSANEKTSLEIAIGASFGGARALVAMKFFSKRLNLLRKKKQRLKSP